MATTKAYPVAVDPTEKPLQKRFLKLLEDNEITIYQASKLVEGSRTGFQTTMYRWLSGQVVLGPTNRVRLEALFQKLDEPVMEIVVTPEATVDLNQLVEDVAELRQLCQELVSRLVKLETPSATKPSLLARLFGL